MIAGRALQGIIVSTADHYSWAARRLANTFSRDPNGYQIELRDFGKLRQMVSSCPPVIRPAAQYLAAHIRARVQAIAVFNDDPDEKILEIDDS
jgi:hypothetical protein